MRKLLTFLIFVISVLSSKELLASHGMGADITYTCVGPNRFVITVSFYRDCSGISAPTTLTCRYQSLSCGTGVTNMTLRRRPCPVPTPPYTACEVSPLCPAYASRSCCVAPGAGCLPGVQRYIYDDTVTLPRGCTDWKFWINDCCRNSAVTNLVSPGSRDLRVEAVLNNVDTNCSNGPRFSTLPVPYICNGILYNYSHGAIDADGDSLRFVLVNPLTGNTYTGTNINFVAPFTATSPMNVTGPFVFNSTNGQMTFTPNGVQQGVLAIRVEEYRDGVLVGYVMRDLQIVVLNSSLCNTPNPIIGNIDSVVNGYAVDTNIVETCPGSALEFKVRIWDPGNNNLTVNSNLSTFPSPIPGATFTTAGSGDTIMATIRYTSGIRDSGCYAFSITAVNDGCPITGNTAKLFRICVKREVTVTPNYSVYCGEPIRIAASGGSASTIVWSPPTGLSTTSGLVTFATPSATTRYTYTSDCGTDTALVIVKPISLVDAGLNDTICLNQTVTLRMTHGLTPPPYRYKWVPSTGLSSDTVVSPTASPRVSTLYRCTVTDRDGCSRTDSVWVRISGFAPPLATFGSPDTICPRDTFRLFSYSEPPGCGATGDPCVGRDTISSIVTGTSGAASVLHGGSASQYPSIYGNFNKSARHQILYRASDLARAIGRGGKIKSIAFEIGTYYLPSANGTDSLQSFTIRMGCFNMDSLTNWENGLTTVFNPKTVRAVSGWNTHVFDQPYDWDGVSDIIVDVCFNNPSISGKLNQKFRWHDCGYKVLLWNNNDVIQCSTNSLKTPAPENNFRPNTRFTVCMNMLDSFLVNWSPFSGVNAVHHPNRSNTSSTPHYNQTYTVTVDNGGCAISKTARVTVDTSVTVDAAPDTFLCSIRPLQLQARTTGRALGGGPLTYAWTSSPVDTSLTTPSLQNPMVRPYRPTWYRVTVTGGACPQVDSVFVNLGTTMPVAHTVKHLSCYNVNDGQIFLNPAGIAPFTYSWSPSLPAVGSPSGVGAGTYFVTVTDRNFCIGYDTITVTRPDSLTLSVNASNLRCNRDNTGSALVLVTGGSMPYRYSWSNGATTSIITGLSAGTYRVTVTDDSGCFKVDSIRISEPLALSSSTIGDSVSTFGALDGDALVLAVGGTPGYSYSWTPGTHPNSRSISGLAAGWYYVTVTDSNLCTTLDTVFIYGPPPIIVSFTTVNNLCFGDTSGIIRTLTTGGYPPYTYSWSRGAGFTTDSLIHLATGSYTFSVTDARGNVVDTVIVITQPNTLNTSIDTVDITCFGSNNGSVTLHASGGTAPYTYSWSGGTVSNDSSIINLGPGNYSVTLTDALGCSRINRAYVYEPTALTSFTRGDSVSFFGALDGDISVTVAGGTTPYSYAWSPGIHPDNDSLSGLAAGWYFVTITDAIGCRKVDSAFVYGPPPIIVSYVKQDNICFGEALGTIRMTVTGGYTPYTYAWSSGAGFTTDSLINLTAGSYTFSITDRRGNLVDTVITILQPLQLTSSMDITHITCFGYNNGIAGIHVSGGTAPYTYSWSRGTVLNDSIVNALAPGAVYCTVTDFNGCSLVDTSFVNEPTLLSANITSTTNILCNGQSNGAATVVGSGGTSPYAYAWSGIGSGPATINTLIAGFYTVSITDANGCQATDTFTILEPSPLLLATGFSDASCTTSRNGRAWVTASGGAGSYRYLWSDPLAQTTDTAGALIGPGLYSVTVTDANNCTISSSVSIGTIYSVSVDLFADSADCNGGRDGSTWSIPSNGTYPYSYTWSAGPVRTDSLNRNLNAGNYTLTVTDAVGCSATGSVLVGEPSAISTQLFTVNPTCTGFANGKAWVNATGGSPGYSYVWSSTPASFTDTLFNIPVGTYAVTVTDSKGCTTIDRTTIVEPNPLLLSFDTITNPTCAGYFDGKITTITTGGTRPFTYLWSNGSSNSSVQNVGPGTYTVTLTDLNNCSVSDSVTLVSPPELQIIAGLADSVSCYGGNDGYIFVLASGGTGALSYGLDTNSMSPSPHITSLTSGAYTIFVRDANTCHTDTEMYIFQPLPMLIHIAPNNPTIDLGGNVQLNVEFDRYNERYVNRYSWSPIQGLSCSDCRNPVAGPYNNTLYTVVVEYLDEDCQATAQVLVNVNDAPDVYIPNAFSPNGDDVNDEFLLIGTGIKSINFLVFDRWGEKVFESNNQSIGWDGYYRGELVSPGVYIYQVDIEYLDQRKISRQGSVTVIR